MKPNAHDPVLPRRLARLAGRLAAWGGLALGLCVTLAWASSAAAREGASDPQLAQLRAQRAAAVARRDALTREQAALEPALNAIGQAISTQKALGPVTADAALETLLQRHREISERLTELGREQRAASLSVLGATQALVDALDRVLGKLSKVAKKRSASGKAARASVRALLAERGKLAVGPVGGGCALPEVELSPSDGPDEARAKLNLLRDAEERCRRRIRKMETRLSRLQDERRLMQEAADFRDEGELFDEESRRRTQVRTQFPAAATSASPPPSRGGGTRDDNSPMAGAGAPPTGGAAENDSAFSTPPPSPTVIRQAQVDTVLGVARADGPDGEIALLAKRKRELEGAAARIRKAHEALAKRARALAP